MFLHTFQKRDVFRGRQSLGFGVVRVKADKGGECNEAVFVQVEAAPQAVNLHRGQHNAASGMTTVPRHPVIIEQLLMKLHWIELWLSIPEVLG